MSQAPIFSNGLAVPEAHERQSTPDSASVKTDELVTMWREIRDRAWERVNSDENQGIYVSQPIQDALSCMNDILDSVEPSE